MQRRKLIDFTFTGAMMKLKKASPIKFKSNWSKESKEICSFGRVIAFRKGFSFFGNLLWRCAHESIGVKACLVRRGLGDDETCPICRMEVE